MKFFRKVTQPYFALILMIVFGLVSCGSGTENSTRTDAAGATSLPIIADNNDVVLATPISSDDSTKSDAIGYPPDSNSTNSSGYPAVSNEVVTPAELTPIPPIEPEPLEAGQGALTGHVYSKVTSKPMRNIPLMLAEIYGEGEDATFILDVAQSPFSEADINGRFYFANVPPADYVLVMGDIENNNYDIVIESGDTGKVWTISADQEIDIGDVFSKELLGYETE